ncbi:uncharacterized protein LOC114253877 [Monomorium pharaonis]|uniref:uncharacterized protein LOC114253877 n=1 Tax=Monomorium pharaonis TaxID=307658 RepID=UPI0017469F82|nr:uncharacterized protein LOC114253877 [Monomorium pharaonis]
MRTLHVRTDQMQSMYIASRVKPTKAALFREFLLLGQQRIPKDLLSHRKVRQKSFVAPQDATFIVFKYLNDDGTEPDDQEDVFYDIGLAKWIVTEIDDTMTIKIKWPLLNPSTFVKKEALLNPDWSEKCIKIKRFYATYPDAANACKMFISDSNYETDNQLKRGLRKKRKPVHLNSESSDKESEPVDENLNKKRKKMVKKDNTWIKTSNNSKLALKAPCIPLPEELGLSPNKIKSQYISQLAQKPTFSLSVQDSDENCVNFLPKITLQKEKEKQKKEAFKKLNKKRQDKAKLKDQKYNSIKTSFSPIENKGKCIDTHLVSSSASDEIDTRTKLSTFDCASTSQLVIIF